MTMYAATLSVVDRRARPIPGAWVRQAGVPPFAADANGIARIDSILDATEPMHVSADGHMGRDVVLVELDRLPSGSYVVALEFGGFLHGFVRCASSEDIQCPATVVAIPSGSFAEGLSASWSTWLDHSGAHMVEVEPDGYFRLQPLDRSETYWIAAGAPCHGLPGAPLERSPSAEPLTLELEELLVAGLRIVDERGRALVSHQGQVGIGRSHRFSGEAVKHIDLTRMARDLAGIPDAEESDEWFVARRIGSGAGVVHVQGQYPGYEPFSIELPLAPCAEGVRPAELRLASTARGFGTLEILFGTGTDRPLPVGVIGRVILTSRSGESSSWPVNIESSDASAIHLNGVPYGEYEVKFQALASPLCALSTVIPQRVEVSPEIASVRLAAIEPHGSLRVDFPRAVGSAVRLSLAREDVPPVELQGAEGQRLLGRPGGRLTLSHGASTIPWLPAGSYIVRGLAPNEYAGQTWRVSVQAGEHEVLDLHGSP